MIPAQFVERRAREIESKTRQEILMSIAAAGFFIAFVAWRFGFPGAPGQRLVLLLAAVWMTVSIYVSRNRIWPARHVPPEAVAATSLDYYLKQLVDRRDHLKREWLWHGPLLLACLLFFLIIFENQLPTPERLMKTLPFIVLLVVWVAAWAWQRWKMARQIQQEIDELKQP